MGILKFHEIFRVKISKKMHLRPTSDSLNTKNSIFAGSKKSKN